jgi:hypothetical protein
LIFGFVVLDSQQNETVVLTDLGHSEQEAEAAAG